MESKKDDVLPSEIDLPNTWRIEPLKYHASMSKGLSVQKTDLVDDGVAIISYGQIHSKKNTTVDLKDEFVRYVPRSLAPTYSSSRLQYGDVVFADTSEDVDGIGNAILNTRPSEIYAGYHTVACRPNPKTFDGKYFAYLIKTDYWRSQLRKLAMGVKVFSITQSILSRSYVLMPPLKEQRRIAKLLDELTSPLDSEEMLLTQQIDVLERYKKSLIHEAVTKGLDPDIPLKPSGVDWIGTIPEHWNAKKLKYVLDNLDYLRAPIEASQRSQNGDVLYEYYGASGAIDYIDDFNVCGTSILVGEDGANLVGRNLPLAYWAEGKYWVNNHAHILRPKNGCMRFYFYVMEAVDIAPFVTGSAQPKLSQENLGKIRLPVPSMDEQEAIAEYLNEKCAKVDAVLEIKRQQVEVLKKRRQSLIYEYVTGKRRVGEAA